MLGAVWRWIRDLPWKRILPQGRAPAIGAEEAGSALERGEAVLVDVREYRELRGGLAAPARWVPTSSFSKQTQEWQRFVEELPRDKLVIIYCAAGVRAGRIADALADLGFDTANLGGYGDWTAAGLPTRPRETVAPATST